MYGELKARHVQLGAGREEREGGPERMRHSRIKYFVKGVLNSGCWREHSLVSTQEAEAQPRRVNVFSKEKKKKA